MPNPFEILEVRKDASDKVVEAAYKALVKEHHPDQGGSEKEFKKIKAAYESIKQNENAASKTPTESMGFDEEFENLGGMDVSETKGTGSVEKGVTIIGDFATASIQALVEIDVSGGVVYQSAESWQKASFNDDSFEESEPDRYFVLFDIKNTSDRLLRWHTNDTQFIGSGGYTYESSNFTLNENRMNSRVRTHSAEIESGRKVKVATLIEQTPPDIEVNEIVHTMSIYNEGKTSGWVQEKERFVFEIESEDKDNLLALPPEVENLTD